MEVEKGRISLEKSRLGYTTGTCAAAAAKAATIMLLTKDVIDKTPIKTPCGITFTLRIFDQKIAESEVSCCVIKDAGDDPDVTNGMKICAMVRERKSGIIIKGGEGIGVVTKPGLSLPVGAPAINPVPLRMIKHEVKKVLPPEKGLEITISAPEGRKRAKKTFNPKLGVEEGISILGTTGVVRPMSDDSWKYSLLPQIDIAKAAGFTTLALTPGNMGEKVALRLGVPAEAIVQMSNFVGYILKACSDKGIKRVLLVGHIGKLIKVAAGNFNTHSRIADQRVKTILTFVTQRNVPKKVIRQIEEALTAQGAASILLKNGLGTLLNKMAEATSMKAQEYVNQRLKVGTALTNLAGQVIGRDGEALRILEDEIWS
jgi:cobalt-precorrin-5B (C1)-methyltransferase